MKLVGLYIDEVLNLF